MLCERVKMGAMSESDEKLKLKANLWEKMQQFFLLFVASANCSSLFAVNWRESSRLSSQRFAILNQLVDEGDVYDFLFFFTDHFVQQVVCTLDKAILTFHLNLHLNFKSFNL